MILIHNIYNNSKTTQADYSGSVIDYFDRGLR